MIEFSQKHEELNLYFHDGMRIKNLIKLIIHNCILS